MAEKPADSGFMSRVRRGIESAVFTETSSPQPVSSPPSKVTSEATPIFGSNTSTTPFPSRAVTSIDPAMVSRIKEQVSARTHEAYGQLQALVQELSSVIPDEQTRFKAALVSMSRLGFNQQSIATIYNDRVEFIKSFASDFEQAAQAKLDQATLQGEGDMKAIDAETTRLQNEISERNARLTELQQRRIQLSAERQEKVNSLTRNSVETREAISMVREELVRERDIVSRYLNN